MSEQSKELSHAGKKSSPEQKTIRENARENAELTPEVAAARIEHIAEGLDSAESDVCNLTEQILSDREATPEERREAERLRSEMETLAQRFLASARPQNEDPVVMEALRGIAKFPLWKRAKPIMRAFYVILGLEAGVAPSAVNKGPEATQAATSSVTHIETLPSETRETPERESFTLPLSNAERHELEQYAAPTPELLRALTENEAERAGHLIGRLYEEDPAAAEALVDSLFSFGEQQWKARALSFEDVAKTLTRLFYALPRELAAAKLEQAIDSPTVGEDVEGVESSSSPVSFQDSFYGVVTDSRYNEDAFLERIEGLQPAALAKLFADPFLRARFGGRLLADLAERDIAQLQQSMNELPYIELRAPIQQVFRSDDSEQFLDVVSELIREGSVHSDSLIAAIGDEALKRDLETFGNFERTFEVIGLEPFLERLPKMDPREQYNFGVAIAAMNEQHHESIALAVEQMETLAPDIFPVYAHLEQGLRYGGAHASADRIRARLGQMLEHSPELRERFVLQNNTFLDRENNCDRELITLISRQDFIERDVESKRGKPGMQSWTLRDIPLHYYQFKPGEQAYYDLERTFREVLQDSERPYEQLISAFQEQNELPSDKGSALLTILTLLRESGDPGDDQELHVERARFEREDNQEALAELQPRLERSARLNAIYTLVLKRLKNKKSLEMMEQPNDDLFRRLRAADTSDKMQLLAEQLDERELDEELREAREDREVLEWAMSAPLMVRFGHTISDEERASDAKRIYTVDRKVTAVSDNVVLESFAALRDLQSRNVPIVGKLMFGTYPRTSKMPFSGEYVSVHDEAYVLPDIGDPYGTTVHENGHFDADIAEEMPGAFTSDMMPLQLEGHNLTELSEGNLYASVSDYAGLTGEERQRMYPDTHPQFEDYGESYEWYFAKGTEFRVKIMNQEWNAERLRKEGKVAEAEKIEQGTRILQKKYDAMKRRFVGQEFTTRGSLFVPEESADSGNEKETSV